MGVSGFMEPRSVECSEDHTECSPRDVMLWVAAIPRRRDFLNSSNEGVIAKPKARIDSRCHDWATHGIEISLKQGLGCCMILDGREGGVGGYEWMKRQYTVPCEGGLATSPPQS